jgi:hypothetical protein
MPTATPAYCDEYIVLLMHVVFSTLNDESMFMYPTMFDAIAFDVSDEHVTPPVMVQFTTEILKCSSITPIIDPTLAVPFDEKDI